MLESLHMTFLKLTYVCFTDHKEIPYTVLRHTWQYISESRSERSYLKKRLRKMGETDVQYFRLF